MAERVAGAGRIFFGRPRIRGPGVFRHLGHPRAIFYPSEIDQTKFHGCQLCGAPWGDRRCLLVPRDLTFLSCLFPGMKLTVILEDRQRRDFDIDGPVSELVSKIALLSSMEGKALFFQGKQLDEAKTLAELGIPEQAVLRVSEQEEPVNRAQPEVIEAEEEDEMAKMLGFKSFGTTKGQTHSNAYGVQISKKTKHRQYLNRKGGQDKPLDN